MTVLNTALQRTRVLSWKCYAAFFASWPERRECGHVANKIVRPGVDRPRLGHHVGFKSDSAPGINKEEILRAIMARYGVHSELEEIVVVQVNEALTLKRHSG
jgi:hypothetical protein